MKKILIVLLAVFTVNISQAQFLRFGFKGGVTSSKVKFDKTTLSGLTTVDGVKDFAIEQGDSKLGMQLGFFGRIQIMGMFIQPEVMFTHSEGEVVLSDVSTSEVYDEVQKFNKVDIPVIVGWKFGPARIGFGPVASIMLSENDGLKDKLKDLTTETYEDKFSNATFGYQIGVGLDILKKLTLDVKYEGNLSKLGSGINLGGTNYKFDQRNPQFIFSVGLFF